MPKPLNHEGAFVDDKGTESNVELDEQMLAGVDEKIVAALAKTSYMDAGLPSAQAHLLAYGVPAPTSQQVLDGTT